MGVERVQILGFRLQAHNLAKRLPPGSALEAAAACGLQNTPPGAAALALAARVEGVTEHQVASALEVDKTLVEGWSVRSSPFFFPAVDLPVFTRGLLPADEQGLRHFLEGFAVVLDEIGMSATKAVELAAAATEQALDGAILTNRELGAELAKRLPPKLRPYCEPSEFTRFGAMLVRPVALRGLFCFAPRTTREAHLVRVDRWLGSPVRAETNVVRAEFARRFLHCFGPSTPQLLAAWSGISPADAKRSWALVEDELVEVEVERGRRWLLGDDLAALEAAGPPAGVRLLPTHDVYVTQRDREVLLPDENARARVFLRSRVPSVMATVLLNGELVGTWRKQQKGQRVSLTVEPFRRLSAATRRAVAEEADLLTRFYDRTVELSFV
jgi:Winged helix DNA-binding domain